MTYQQQKICARIFKFVTVYSLKVLWVLWVFLQTKLPWRPSVYEKATYGLAFCDILFFRFF